MARTVVLYVVGQALATLWLGFFFAFGGRKEWLE